MSPDRPLDRGYKVIGTIIVYFFSLWCAYTFLRAYATSGRRSISNYLVSNLRRIETAKQRWAEDNHATNGSFISDNELQRYLGTNFNFLAVQQSHWEHYHVNVVGEQPTALLRSGISSLYLPKGTLLRDGGRNGAEVKLPQSQTWEPLDTVRKRRR